MLGQARGALVCPLKILKTTYSLTDIQRKNIACSLLSIIHYIYSRQHPNTKVLLPPRAYRRSFGCCCVPHRRAVVRTMYFPVTRHHGERITHNTHILEKHERRNTNKKCRQPVAPVWRFDRQRGAAADIYV